MGLFNRYIFRLWLLPVAFCLLPPALYSQSPSLQTSIDKKDILIGEQLKLTLKGIYEPGNFNVHWLMIPDSIPHFDIVDKGKADTIIYKDNSKAIEQTITFTSFDSGKWTIPSFRVNFDPVRDDTTLNLYTDSIPVQVSYAVPDSTNRLRDIKPILEVNISDYTWYYIAAGILLLLIAVYLLWRYLKKRKQVTVAIAGTRLSPYDEAIQELGKLDQYDLQQPGQVKIYHTRLADIFKIYLSRKRGKDLMNSTTGDLLIRMSEIGFSQQQVSSLATALRCSDAVKFAKYIPGIIESKDSFGKIKEMIGLIEQQTINNLQIPVDKM